MVLRTASNYTMPPPGVSAAENFIREKKGYSGFGVSIESAYSVGERIVDEITGNWEHYRETVPSM